MTQTLSREVAIEPARTALLFVDVQKYNCTAEATRRFAQRFADLTDGAQQAICDDICDAANAQPSVAKAAQFFARFRDLTAGGFYSAPEGRQDLGYLGNVRQTKFDGPPRDVLRKLGLDAAAT